MTLRTERWDLAVIGSGPGGYAAALTAARRGARVCLIEREQWGGVCLNVGCIPTKALVSVAHLARRIRQAGRLGITVGSVSLDYPAILARNAAIVTRLRQGLMDLLRRERIELVAGQAAFEGPHQLAITRDGATAAVTADRVIIAAGARPLAGPWRVDERRLLSYRGLLALTHLPPSLLVIGGGVIGCEFASLLAAFGTSVTLIEQQPRLLPAEDPDAVRWLTQRLTAEGATVFTGTTVQQLVSDAEGVRATLADGTTRTAAYALIAIGLAPTLDALRLDAAGIAAGRGLDVDASLRTSQPHIAAIGDCLPGHGLAHWASAEGAAAARTLLGDAPQSVDPSDVPRCAFTEPELAHIGPLESAVAGARVSRLSFGALGKSHCDEDTDGFVKLLVDPATDQVLGATIVGAHASSLIHYAVLARRHGLTAKQLARTITAHPTLPEAITETAAQLYGESLVAASRASTAAARRSPA